MRCPKPRRKRCRPGDQLEAQGHSDECDQAEAGDQRRNHPGYREGHGPEIRLQLLQALTVLNPRQYERRQADENHYHAEDLGTDERRTQPLRRREVRMLFSTSSSMTPTDFLPRR